MTLQSLDLKLELMTLKKLDMNMVKMYLCIQGEVTA